MDNEPRLIRSSTILLISLLVITPSFAQRHDVHFSSLGPEDGLSSSWILSLYQDRTGFLWVGTYEGLNRFDGNTFKVFKSNSHDSSSLFRDYITGITEDAGGTLWVVTSGGLHSYDRDRQSFHRFIRSDRKFHLDAANKFISLTTDRSSRLWLASEAAGVVSFDVRTGVFRSFVHDPADEKTLSSDLTRSVSVDRDGQVWVATENGVDVIDAETGIVQRWSQRQPSRIRSILRSVVGFMEDDHGQHWFTVAHGALLHWRHDGVWEEFIPPWVAASKRDVLSMTKIVQDRKGRLWIGSYFDGLLQFDPVSRTFQRFVHEPSEKASLSAMTVTALSLDRSENLWVGTESGLNKCDTKPPKFIHHVVNVRGSDSKRLNNVRSMAEDRHGALWLGVEGKPGDVGLLRYSPQRDRVEPVAGRDGSVRRPLVNIYDMSRDETGALWMATYGDGLVRFDPDSRRFSRTALIERASGTAYPNDVRSVHVGRSGIVWFAPRGREVHMFDQISGQVKSFEGYPGEPAARGALNILVLYEDHLQTLWAGTLQGGVARLDQPWERFATYQFVPGDSTSMSYDVVASIAEDRQGRLWVGTTEGLNRFDRSTHTFEQFTEANGFPAAVVCAIVPDASGRLWMSTDRGVVRYDERLPVGERFRSYGPSDGLQGFEFNRGAVTVTRAGEVFFAGRNGLNSFIPDSIRDNPYLPRIVLTSVRLSNQERSFGRALETLTMFEVAPEDHVVSVEFAALEYSNASENRYSHQLEGFEKSWSPPHRSRSVTYTNLDPGTYTLRVRASNSDGHWSEEELTLAVVVLPPFWDSWWFRSLLLLSVAGAIGLLVYRREVHQRVLRRAQEEFSHRLISEQESERQRIAAELHDGLGQNILIIKNKALLAIQKHKPSRTVKKELDGISDLASQTLDETRRISRNLRPYLLDRFGLTEALREMVDTLDRTSPVRWTADIASIDQLVAPDQQINVYRVVQEALTNILRHAEATEAVVRISEEEERIIIDVRDNGRGMDADPLTKRSRSGGGFGLAGIRERIRVLGGTFDIQTTLESGTRIIMTIPSYHETDRTDPHR